MKCKNRGPPRCNKCGKFLKSGEGNTDVHYDKDNPPEFFEDLNIRCDKCWNKEHLKNDK